MEWKPNDERYFWSGWFTGQPFALLATLFVLLSAADLIATLNLLPYGVREGNALASAVLERFGPPGFALYKVALVAFIIGTLKIVHHHDARRGSVVLWAAIILMTYVAVLHISLLATHMYLIHRFDW